MTRLPFTKMHGAGNDFVLLDGLRHALPPLLPLAARLADRRFGLGCDQVLVLRAPQHAAAADFRMEIYNADGSQVEMCGNGLRCLYKYLRDTGHARGDTVRVETPGRVVTARAAGQGRVCVDMGAPEFAPAKIPTTLSATAFAGAPDAVLNATLEAAGESWRVSCASLGNPHCVTFVRDVTAAPVARAGAAISAHAAFPERCTVAFVERESRTRLRQRTFERGAGETLACGSAACAAAVVAMLLGHADAKLCVALPGGELEISWERARAGASVFMTGPAATVASGEFWLEG